MDLNFKALFIARIATCKSSPKTASPRHADTASIVGVFCCKKTQSIFIIGPWKRFDFEVLSFPAFSSYIFL